MPWYNDLRPTTDYHRKDYSLIFPSMTENEKKRCITNLLKLIPALDQAIPARRTENNLIIANWNLKEFGHNTQRLPESYFYIAEIINRFDLVAVQEIKSTLKDLEIILRILGKEWAYLINDITEGRAGNSERSGYLYHRQRVRPSGLAGEIALWEELTANSTVKQLKRAPYITGFETGWKKFELINVHLHPGETAADLAYRLEEVKLLTQAIDYKVTRNRLWSNNLVLVGDMNLYHPTPTNPKDQPAIAAINQINFREVESLIGLDTNATGSQAYDRLFFHVNPYFRFARAADGRENGGVFPCFSHLYTEADAAAYTDAMLAVYGGDQDLNQPDIRAKYFKNTWRKNQLSDHYPIWAEINIDDSAGFLQEKLTALGG